MSREKHPKNPLKMVNLIIKIENKNQMNREQQNYRTKNAFNQIEYLSLRAGGLFIPQIGK